MLVLCGTLMVHVVDVIVWVGAVMVVVCSAGV